MDAAVLDSETSAADEAPPTDTGARHGRLANWALLLAAVVYGLSQIQVWPVKLGWDETIYFSQVSKAAPAAFFSAPRARGITWLVWPLGHFTSSVTDLRAYLTVVSAIALYLAFRVWFKVLPPAAVVISAVCFGGLWITRFYGAELMPNLWVAFGVIAAVGGFLRLMKDDRDVLGLIALPVGLAVAALMRPTDAAYVAAPLIAFNVLVPGWIRHWRSLVVTVGGSILGAAPWVIEAYARWGGVSQRLKRASAIQGGLGWHPNRLAQHWQTIDGPLLCRPCTPNHTPSADTIWLPLIAVGAVLAIVAARRLGIGTWNVLVPIVASFVVAISYLVLVDYSAPRFLLPAFGLVSLPIGLGLWWLVTLGRGRVQIALVSVLVVVLGAQLVAQQLVVHDHVKGGVSYGKTYTTLADQLNKVGVKAPCAVSGTRSPMIAYYAGCASRNVGGHDGSITREGLIALSQREPVARILMSGQKVPKYTKTWTKYDLPVTSDGLHWVAYVSPNASAG